ncbi:MarR family winged helix-turn-helix transcriptional regulator [Amycolatopsis sp. CA-230715]|uniref:MarR family winged helix-turn-helix transcriptional regulator n=1 Tax=Amycolatopsis sp. CA-230715 TaxID=2745196 RepID=UPI001C00FDD8|nr:MarR family winged helix-turn-helix transcriptional regulator [Amycolatopsis sp. CA-230715]QWF80729.1 hypothetical protein HUW46_04153 [Amycolatopsis sp. CA-230715]
MTDLRRLFSELVRLETESWNAIDARLRADFGIALGKFEFLELIDRVDGCRVQDIARELAITVGGTSKLVDRIEAAGDCRRRSNPEDGRSSVISLTAKGKRLLAEAGAVVDEELEAWFGAHLSPRELDRLSATLTRLREKGRR